MIISIDPNKIETKNGWTNLFDKTAMIIPEKGDDILMKVGKAKFFRLVCEERGDKKVFI